jgi:transposase
MNEKYTTTRGRPAKPLPDPSLIIKAVVHFLQMFMSETLSKRIVSVVLIAIGTQNDRISELTGMSDRSIWRVKKAIKSGNIDDAFALGRGSGRPGNAKGFEGEIAEELEKNNYQTRQQIADMIYEKFGVTMSVSAVGKLLKKTASGG